MTLECISKKVGHYTLFGVGIPTLVAALRVVAPLFRTNQKYNANDIEHEITKNILYIIL